MAPRAGPARGGRRDGSRWRRGGQEVPAAPSGARPIHRGCDGPGPARAPGASPGAAPAVVSQHSDPQGARDRAGRSAGRCRRRGRSGHGHHGEADEGLRIAALLPAAAGPRCPPRGAAPETVSDPRPGLGGSPHACPASRPARSWSGSGPADGPEPGPGAARSLGSWRLPQTHTPQCRGAAVRSLQKFRCGVTFGASAFEKSPVREMNGRYSDAVWVSQAGSRKENLFFT